MDGVGGTGQPTRPNSFTNLGHNLVGVNQLQQKNDYETFNYYKWKL